MGQINNKSKPDSRASKGLQAAAIASAVALCAAAIYWLTPSEPKRTPVNYDIFVDQSGSIKSEEQLKGWRTVFYKLLKRLGPSDTLYLFGMHDQTANAAPLFQVELPDLPEDAGLREREEWKEKLARARKDATEAFQVSMRPAQRANYTDIFAALNRVNKDQTRKRTLWFMSDMLHSTRELDMEKTRLTDEKIGDLLHPIVANHKLRQGSLAGVEVYCLLNSIEERGDGQLNDRQALERFWKTLFDHLGAEIKSFETHLNLEGGAK